MNMERAIAELSAYASYIETWDYTDIRTGEIYAATREGVLHSIEILAAQTDEPETAACHCRDGGGGAIDMRDCPTHLRECYGWPPVEGEK